MARSSLQLSLDQRTPVNLTEGRNGTITKGGRQLLRKIIRHLEGVLGGSVQASHLVMSVDGAQPVAACAVVTLASVAAADTLTVAGTAFTAVNGGTPANNEFDMSGTNTADATDLARSINASSTALVSNNIEASNLQVTITCNSVTEGTGVRIAGYEFYAVNGVLSAYASYGDFDMSGNATAEATALKNAINAHPVLCHQVFATSAAGVVTVRQRRGTTSLGAVQVCAKAGVTPSGLSVGAAAFAAGASVCISAKQEGTVGNAIAITSNDGATLAIFGSATMLTNGAGGNVTPIRMVMGGSAN